MLGCEQERGLRTLHHTTALSFLKKGYQVIPLSKETGTPIVKFRNIPITKEFIESINWLGCDYALLMRGIWCIDIDTHALDGQLANSLKSMIKIFGADLFSVLRTDRYNNGLDGYSSILRHELKDELINNFKNTYLELTASGGMHILFKKKPSIDYSQKIGVLDGIDIKANDNNYVKIYPSDGREVLQAVSELPEYNGEFEKQVFTPPKEIVAYFGDSLIRPIKNNGSHKGKEAYERIVNGQSMYRNDDLFKAACWAFENNNDIHELRTIIGHVKGNDVFTQEEFDLTIESARRKVAYVSIGT